MPAAAATVGVGVGAAVIMESFFLLSSPRPASIVARRFPFFSCAFLVTFEGFDDASMGAAPPFSPEQASLVPAALRVRPPAIMLLVLTAPTNPGAIWASLTLPKSGVPPLTEVLLLRAPGIVDGRF